MAESVQSKINKSNFAGVEESWQDCMTPNNPWVDKTILTSWDI